MTPFNPDWPGLIPGRIYLVGWTSDDSGMSDRAEFSGFLDGNPIFTGYCAEYGEKPVTGRPTYIGKEVRSEKV